MKFRVILLVLLLLSITIVSSLIYFTSPVDKNNENTVYFTIKNGEDTSSVLARLEESNLIKSATMTKMVIKFKGGANFQAGTFQLSQSQSVSSILKSLSDANNISANSVTFLEGYRIINFASKAQSSLGIKEEEFLLAANDKAFYKKLTDKYELLRDFQVSNNSIYIFEGLLAPDTYSVKLDINSYELIEKLVEQSNLIYTNLKNDFEKSNLSVNEVYTLASMIEVEAKTLEDRELVAGVFMNRIKNNIPLGSDVTTYYGLQIDMSSRDLTVNELAEDNGYNTRSNMLGLPIGPINSPSMVAIKAALNYKKTEMMYFVSDKNGKIYTSKNYDEHNKIIENLKEKGLWFNY